MSFTGSEVDVQTRDVDKEAAETAAQNKQAIHQALNEVTAELDSNKQVAEAKKEIPKPDTK